jgi:hypothetical protein
MSIDGIEDEITNDESTDEYDAWWSDTHNGTGEIEIESDCDSTIEDCYRDYEVDEI